MEPRVISQQSSDSPVGGCATGGMGSIDPSYETGLTRATQHVRVHQSKRILPLVAIGAVAFAFTYADEAPPDGIIIWTSLVVLSTMVRYLVIRYIRRRLDDASPEHLRTYERWLFATSMSNAVFIGSGFWWVGIGGSERAVFAVTLLCCIYAIGSMINASVEYRSFAPTVVVNLGQGVMFSAGLVIWEPMIALSLLITMLLQLGFGRVNAAQFAETIRIRMENLNLVDQLRTEKQAVEEALEKAREANASKSHFMAAASHDLRQPLHALRLYLGSLSLHVESDGDREILHRINEAADVLHEQFDGLLDLSRFDANGVQAEVADFRLDLLLERLAAECGPQARARGLHLTCKVDPCTVSSDPMHVERLIRNLIDNAIRYTDAGGVTMVAVPNGDHMTVTISDTGIGISQDDQARVFQDFVQLHNRGRQRAEGVGLGLAIVRRIDGLLGLGLRLESQPGAGTTFEFDLPLVDCEPVNARSHESLARSLAASGRKAAVWTVEDDIVVREAMQLQLEAWGCDVTLAGSWDDLEAAHRTQGHWPDLALIDDMLGIDESGLDVARRLESFVGTDRIAMITGNTHPERLRELRSSGFPVLLKPTRSEDLWRLVYGCARESSEARTA